eukprot:GILI01010250.1.p1 GENE.GILI01010250.1~~GILI01010250.1.p1  ORF type:complete len:352 (+),score=95.59 GILI01010250.1:66-1121(+)
MNTETLLALAQNAVDVGKLQAACEFFEVALHQSPNNIEVLEAYAEIMLHYVQDSNRAEQMLRHAINVSPNEGYVKYLNLAQMIGGTEAVLCYKKAYGIIRQEMSRTRKRSRLQNFERELSTCLCAVAELYLTDLCDEDDAEQNCEQAIEEAKKVCERSIEVHQLEASLRLSQQQPGMAFESLRKAVALTRKLGEEYQPPYESKIELAKLLMQVDHTEAFQFLLEVLQLNDTNAYVWFLMGEVARLRKRYHDSARLLKHARTIATVANAGQEAINEIDNTIRMLIDEMGGDAAVAAVPHMDGRNPIDYLEPEEGDEVHNEGEGPDNMHGDAAEDDDDIFDDEPAWEKEEGDN